MLWLEARTWICPQGTTIPSATPMICLTVICWRRNAKSVRCGHRSDAAHPDISDAPARGAGRFGSKTGGRLYLWDLFRPRNYNVEPPPKPPLALGNACRSQTEEFGDGAKLCEITAISAPLIDFLDAKMRVNGVGRRSWCHSRSQVIISL
jgi:hypothetical protein